MKIRVVKRKMIKEAAKTVADLPSNSDVELHIYDDYIRVKIRNIGDIDAKKIDCKAKGIPVFSVGSAGAKDKWGPLLYDILLEAAWFYKGASVTSDRSLVTNDAKGVWDFYLRNRMDVEEIRMDIDKGTIKRFSPERPEKPFLKHLTPSEEDDCTQVTSVAHAVNKGDWEKYSYRDQYFAAMKSPEKAMKWWQQGTAHAYVKKDKTTLNSLKDIIKIYRDGEPAKRGEG